MRVPFRLFFVGWWMAVQSWMVAGQHYHKPSVSLSPRVATLGGNVTVRCSGTSDFRAEFSLYKTDSPLPRQTAKGYEAEFILSNIDISDAGIYWCHYCFTSVQEDRCSEYSDPVHIHVTDPSIPKPSIRVKPKHRHVLYSNITIACQGQEDGLKFFLLKRKTWEVSQVAAAAGTTATFSFLPVRMEDAGSYICQYHRRSTPFVWSEPSDPLELIVKDPRLPKPSINVRPKGRREVGMNVTAECKGPKNGLTFSLHKSKNVTALQRMKAEGDTATFSLPPLRPEDAGKYTCQYYQGGNPFVHSEPSDPVQVVVTDISPQKPMTIIWASVAAGLLLALFLLVLILVLCKKRRKGSTVKEGTQPVNRLLEQNAGMGQDDGADHGGVTYAVLKIKDPASQHKVPESCVYATVAKEKSRKV